MNKEYYEKLIREKQPLHVCELPKLLHYGIKVDQDFIIKALKYNKRYIIDVANNNLLTVDIMFFNGFRISFINTIKNNKKFDNNTFLWYKSDLKTN